LRLAREEIKSLEAIIESKVLSGEISAGSDIDARLA